MLLSVCIDKVTVWLLNVGFMLPFPFHLGTDLHKQSTRKGSFQCDLAAWKEDKSLIFES